MVQPFLALDLSGEVSLVVQLLIQSQLCLALASELLFGNYD